VGILHQLINLAKEVIFQLDVAEENKTLSIEERELRRRLKSNYLGLLSLQKVKLSQRALMSQRTSWETPRGRYDEHNSKFSLSYETKV
jgi:regulator of replication initiation timing